MVVVIMVGRLTFDLKLRLLTLRNLLVVLALICLTRLICIVTTCRRCMKIRRVYLSSLRMKARLKSLVLLELLMWILKLFVTPRVTAPRLLRISLFWLIVILNICRKFVKSLARSPLVGCYLVDLLICLMSTRLIGLVKLLRPMIVFISVLCLCGNPCNINTRL